MVNITNKDPYLVYGFYVYALLVSLVVDLLSTIASVYLLFDYVSIIFSIIRITSFVATLFIAVTQRPSLKIKAMDAIRKKTDEAGSTQSENPDDGELIHKLQQEYYREVTRYLIVDFIITLVSSAYIGYVTVNLPADILQNYELRLATTFGACVGSIGLNLYLMKSIADVFYYPSYSLNTACHAHYMAYCVSRDDCTNTCRKCYQASIDDKMYLCLACPFNEARCESCWNESAKEEGVEEATQSAWVYIIVQLYGQHWKLVVSGFCAILLSSISSLYLVQLKASTINEIMVLNKSQFLHVAATWILVRIIASVINVAKTVTKEILNSRVEATCSAGLLERVFELDIAFHKKTSISNLVFSPLRNTRYFIENLPDTSISSFTSAIGGVYMCLTSSWQLSIVCMCSLAPVCVLKQVVSNQYTKSQGRGWKNDTAMSHITSRIYSSIKTVHTFVMEREEATLYKKLALENQAESESSVLSNNAYTTLQTSLTEIIDLMNMFFGGLLVMNSQNTSNVMSLGQLLAFESFWSSATSGLSTTSYYWNQLRNCHSEIAIYNSVMKMKDYILKDDDIRPMLIPPKSSPINNSTDSSSTANQQKSEEEPKEDLRDEQTGMSVEFKDVTFGYKAGEENQVIKGLNLKIEPGTMVALVGKSGCGKTTMLNLMMRLWDVSSGSILLDGKPIQSYSTRSIRRQMASVDQETVLLPPLTISENLSYGLTTDQFSHNDVLQASSSSNCHDFIQKQPKNYDTKYHEYGPHSVTFSTGEKQRMALARCFLRKQARIMFLDEVTSALDADNELKIQQSMDKLVGKDSGGKGGRCTVVMVAHRLSTVVGADKIVVVDGGKVVEEGRHSELVKKGGVYARLVKKQVERLMSTLDSDAGDRSAADVVDDLLGAE